VTVSSFISLQEANPMTTDRFFDNVAAEDQPLPTTGTVDELDAVAPIVLDYELAPHEQAEEARWQAARETANTLKIGRTVTHGIASLQDASEVYRRAAHEHMMDGGGGSDFFDGELTFEGRQYRISWNGRVWAGTKTGDVLAYDPS
jgi:hypothetical protein